MSYANVKTEKNFLRGPFENIVDNLLPEWTCLIVERCIVLAPNILAGLSYQ